MNLLVTLPLKTMTGYPYPGGAVLWATDTEVLALGKLTAYGDSVTRYMLRLRDGREVFVKASEQASVAEKWLRKLAKGIVAAYCDREVGWAVVWKEIA